MRLRKTRTAGLLLLLGTLGAGADAADTPEAGRVPWTTSRLAGTPDPPPPYTVAPAFPKLAFRQPVVLANARGTHRLFVAELKGKVYSFPEDPSCARADLALDLELARPGLTMFYGLAFPPDFATRRFAYLCYVLKDGQPDGTRVSRFEVTRDDPPRILAETEKVLITWLAGGHNGGCLQFGPDGYLYISTGDGAGPSPPDPLDTGQDLGDLLSSILRIDVAHESPGLPYRVPSDNPFFKVAGARPEIWAFGFRNPWKMSFDRATGDLWAGDVGWELWEMVDRVERGGNYGWSVREGRQPVHPDGKHGPGPILPPVIDHPHSEAASITGGYVYRGARLKELAGAYIYGDFQTGKVWGLRCDGTKLAWHAELASTPLQLVAFGEGEEGELYALDYERTGAISRFIPNPAAKVVSDFPRLLSRTGLFSSTRNQTPAPGVLRYAINAEAWSDHALAERFLALPGRSRVEGEPSGNWTFPEGTVLARTVALELRRGDPNSRHRIETQVLHLETGTWRAYTYLWDDDQADARLVDAGGASRTMTVRDPSAPGGERLQSYRVASRAECMLCHNPWAAGQPTGYGRQSASPLAFNTRQLNRDRDDNGRVANQLHTLGRLGVFARPLPGGPIALPRQVDPRDESAPLERRARSYLQVNCAHCHQFGAGGTATLVLAEAIELGRTGTVGVRPGQGTFGIEDARIIAPGVPEGSVLFYRMAKLGGGRMPRLGSSLVDENGLALIAAWIAEMPKPHHDRDAVEPGERTAALAALAHPQIASQARLAAIGSLLGTTRGALALLRAIDRESIVGATRRDVIALARDHPRAEVRDLFERFVPDAGRIKRLGESFLPEAVLAVKGDPGRGERLFFAEGVTQCKDCHRIAGKGSTLGPDLSTIGAKYDRPTLLREIVDPSRSIEPKFGAYVLETKGGQVHAGLLAEKTGQEVVLKDAKDHEVRVATADVARLVPQTRSLMPDLLLRDLTAQQAADLLEYLATRKKVE